MAKVCSNCGATLQDGTKFCGKCGQKVPIEPTPKVCPNCGATLQDGVKFCGKCGHKTQVEQTTTPQQNQDTAPQQRKDTAPQQNQNSSEAAKENIKNFFRGGFQNAVEKFSALSLKNKAICAAVVVIALFVVFGGNSKIPNKYLCMSPKDFAAQYNAMMGIDNLKIVKTEVKGNDCIYTLKASECRMGGMVQNGELVTVMVKGSNNNPDLPLIMIGFVGVMEKVKTVDVQAVLRQLGQGRTVVENNGVRFMRVVENSENTFMVASANYNPK